MCKRIKGIGKASARVMKLSCLGETTECDDDNDNDQVIRVSNAVKKY
jgi:hypothetical protein